jgi:predicted aspartyl protease
MLKLASRCGILIILSASLALVSSACSSTNSINPSNAQTPGANPPTTPPLKASKLPTISAPVPEIDNFSRAIDTATGAVNISQGAVSRDDWSLVAKQWQQAINLLKAVPSQNSHYATALNKLNEYQSYLADAQLRATPPPSPKACSDTNPDFFSVPIKDHMGRIPVVEVNFNDVQKFEMLFDTGASNTLITGAMATRLRLVPTGAGQAAIADGSVVEVPIAKVKSMEIDGHIVKDLPVAVATSMNIGLLGQDFYKGYEVKITDTAIEFRRSNVQKKATSPKKSCLADTSPQSFQAPIKVREHGIPVVEVTFDNKYKFPMLFDTGASHTLITESMANKLKLKPVGSVTVGIADGSAVTLPVAVVKSSGINIRVRRDMPVSVALAADVGLLGQDFYEGYDVTIKDNVIEFHRQAGAQS